MDPHSQNESVIHMMNGQVDERLTGRDGQLQDRQPSAPIADAKRAPIACASA